MCLLREKNTLKMCSVGRDFSRAYICFLEDIEKQQKRSSEPQ